MSVPICGSFPCSPSHAVNHISQHGMRPVVCEEQASNARARWEAQHRQDVWACSHRSHQEVLPAPLAIPGFRPTDGRPPHVDASQTPRTPNMTHTALTSPLTPTGPLPESSIAKEHHRPFSKLDHEKPPFLSVINSWM